MARKMGKDYSPSSREKKLLKDEKKRKGYESLKYQGHNEGEKHYLDKTKREVA